MSELKPCRLCGAKPRWEELNGATCPTPDCPKNTVWGWWEESWNKWNASPAPELPEGYREDENGHLVDPNGLMTAWKGQDGLLTMLAKPWDVEAVMIWLQRRER